MDTRQAVLALRSEVGEAMVEGLAGDGELRVGGKSSEVVLAPETVDEMGRAVAAAGRVGLAIVPLGGMTALGPLLPPSRPFVAVRSLRLAGVVEHAADDMTVSVRPGTPVAELSRTLASAGQRLPIDVPHAERATVGGMIAVSSSGPLRFGHGTVRDYLIGITVVDSAGRRVHAGGRVVKNVAGYDLMKLHTGARGTLGVVVEATFKVKPIPDRFAWLAAATTPEDAESIRRGLIAGKIPAAALELMSEEIAGTLHSVEAPPGNAHRGDANRRRGFILAVGIEGVDSEVRWQEEQVRRVMSAAGAKAGDLVEGEPARDFLRRLVDFGAAEGEELLVRGAVLPSRLPDLIAAWSAAAPEARIVAEVGTGVIRMRGHSPPAGVAALRAAAVKMGGHAIVETMPRTFRDHIDPWGEAPSPLAERLKAALDPESVFLPGSFFGLGAGSPGASGGPAPSMPGAPVTAR